jgi:hypothetical protein
MQFFLFLSKETSILRLEGKYIEKEEEEELEPRKTKNITYLFHFLSLSLSRLGGG